MSAFVTSASSNGRGSDAWRHSWTHLSVDRRSSRYCRVTFDHPPINAITVTTVGELDEIIGLIEEDRDLDVVVFDSANPSFYLSSLDGAQIATRAWLDLLGRLSAAPVISIALIRGRACGAGKEFALACDLRFASRENALLGRFGAQRAEQYGYVSRAIADDMLNAAVDEIAAAIARTKS